MVPVCVGVVVINVFTVLLGYYNPRALRVFFLIVAADPKLLHILVGIVGILGTGAVSCPEQVVQVN